MRGEGVHYSHAEGSTICFEVVSTQDPCLNHAVGGTKQVSTPLKDIGEGDVKL